MPQDTSHAVTRGPQLPGQAVITSFLGTLNLPRQSAVSAETYRTMTRHPTIALARAFAASPIIASSWSIKANDDADDEWIEFVEEELMHRREQILQMIVFSLIDYGWFGAEKVFEYDESDGMVHLKSLKQLIVDATSILIEGRTGDWLGFRQAFVHLFAEQAFLVTREQEGQQYYGKSLLENIREPWLNWKEASAGAERYDAYVAGAHWRVFFPPDARDEDGEYVVDSEGRTNSDVAQDILDALESSGSVAIPQSIEQYMSALNTSQTAVDAQPFMWRIEIQEDKGSRQPGFLERLEYLDKQLIRGLIVPERAALEASNAGSRADSITHSDSALLHSDIMHRCIVREINAQIIDHLLSINFGPDAVGSVRLEATPLADEKRRIFRAALDEILKSPKGQDLVDSDALFDMAGLPKAEQIIDDAVASALPPVPSPPVPPGNEEGDENSNRLENSTPDDEKEDIDSQT